VIPKGSLHSDDVFRSPCRLRLSAARGMIHGGRRSLQATAATHCTFQPTSRSWEAGTAKLESYTWIRESVWPEARN
jgi:hypothetical protein